MALGIRFHPKQRISHVACYSKTPVNAGTSPVASRPQIKRPSIPRQNPVVENEASELLQKTQNVLKSASTLDLFAAREILSEVKETLIESPSLTPDEIISIAGLLGTVLLKSPVKPSDPDLGTLVHSLSKQILDRNQFFQSSDLCLLIWFYGCCGPAVLRSASFNGVEGVVKILMRRIEFQGVDSIKDALRLFWGLDRMRLKGHTSVTRHIIRRIGIKVENSSKEELSDLASLLLATARLRVLDGMEFFRRVSKSVNKRFSEFEDDALCDFVTAFALYEFRRLPSVFEVFCEEIETRMMSLKLPVFIKILLSLSRIHYLPNEALLRGLTDRLLTQDEALSPVEVTNCLQALSWFNYSSPGLLRKLLDSFFANSEAYSASQTGCVLASCVVLNNLSKDDLILGLEVLNRKLTTSKRSQRGCLYLHQILTHASLVLSLDISLDLILKEWRVVAQQEWSRIQARPSVRIKTSIASIASELGLELVEDLSPVGKIPILFIQSFKKDQKIVLDLIDPQRDYYINSGGSGMLPWKLWQHKILEKEGFKILSILEESWEQIPQSKRVRHLARKLDFWTIEEIEKIEISLGLLKNRQE